MKKKFLIIALLILGIPGFFLFAGGQPEETANGAEKADTSVDSTKDAAPPLSDQFSEKIEVSYAVGFEVEYHETYKVVTVKNPWPGAESGFSYVLVQDGTEPPDAYQDAIKITIPVKKMVSMSTSYLPGLADLNETDPLVAMDSFLYTSTPAVIAKIESDEVVEVGSGATVNVEKVIELDPDLIMTMGMGNEWDTHPKLLEAGLPVVISGDWNEKTPLGRAEWIKFISLFFNKEDAANQIFDQVVSNYDNLKSKVGRKATIEPTVFTGSPWQGTWNVPGGKSYMAVMFADAGVAYPWAETDLTGSLYLDFEKVYEKAKDADVWLCNTFGWNSLDDIKATDGRYTEFNAFKTGTVYNNNKRTNPNGGNDYYESGSTYPDKVLADLIKIFHPDLIPDHELIYFKKLD